MIKSKIKKIIKKIFIRKAEPKSKIENKKFRLGAGVEFSNSSIGDYSYVSPNSKLHSTTIGKFCSIGPNVIIGYGEHPIKFLSTSPLFYYGKKKFDIKIATKDYFNHHEQVFIKNDVWIGANVYIKNGITIGNGAVIAAGAVVIKDVPDYAIIGGVPGKLIKFRFDEIIIKELLEIKWWDWGIDKLINKHHLFISENIDELLVELRNEAKYK